jgi:hypothetical protein
LATQTVTPGSELGTSLETLLCCSDIAPGTEPGYAICKEIYLYHPLGQKLAESPMSIAVSFPREVTIPDSPEDDCRRAFDEQWAKDGIDETIVNVATQARVYGIASVALLQEGVAPAEPVDVKSLADAVLSFNVLDPLNTAGSLVLSQNPNAMDFQKHRDIAVNGVRYHRSRTVTLMNERPIYIAYSTSAYGFVGRSVYQRALYPLKSFIQTMRADDMVARKVGLIVATLKMASNVIDRVMAWSAAFKRQLLKAGGNDNVISIAEGETVASLDLTNLDGPLTEARTHILENIAAADDMPAKMLNNETFAEGFGEGTEDAKRVAVYIEGKRKWLRPLYDFFDMVEQRRAWGPDFYETIKKKYPEEYGGVSYEAAFYRWSNSFTATWPSLLREPESELIKVEETKFKAVIAAAQVIMPTCDPDNKALVLKWMADTFNSVKRLFPVPLELDWEALAAYTPPAAEGADKEPEAAPPFSSRDSADEGHLPGRMHHIEAFLHKHGNQIARLGRRG